MMAILLIASGAAQPAGKADRPVPGTFFGMSVKDGLVTPWVPYGTARSWDGAGLSWTQINPSPGVYVFTNLDAFIAKNQAHGAEMIYTFGRTPQWASSKPNVATPYGPGQCAPPAALADWDRFVSAIVTRAAGRIKYWELWNEPNDPEFWCADAPTSAQALVALGQHAHDLIRKIDPAAGILSPALTGASGPHWLDWYLSAGGRNLVDIVTFHGYSSATAEDILAISAKYRAVMDARGLAEKPLWDTESSWADADGHSITPPSATQAGYIAKSYLLHWSQGVRRFVWYAWDGGPVWGGLWTSREGASPAAKAYEQTFRWMVGATLNTPCSKNADGVWICALTRPGGYTAQAIWISGASATVKLPSRYVQFRDLAGVVHPIAGGQVLVGDQPILVETRDLP